MDPEELIPRARALTPTLAKRAAACEERRSLLPETLADFRTAGFLRLLAPSRFAGHEVGLQTLSDVLRAVGRGCGSSAWCLALFATHNRLAALFDERAQREVFEQTAGTPLAAVYAPSGTASPAALDGEEGFRLRGRWAFASGCDHAGWVALAARVVGGPERAIPDVRCFLVPAGQFRIDDTWYVAGLRGTGSKDVVIEDAFVPAHRVVAFLDIARGTSPGARPGGSPLLRWPVLPLLALAAGGPALGIAEGALDAFRDHARGAARAVASGTALALGEAMALIDAAELVLRGAQDRFTRACGRGARLDPAERARYLLDGAAVVASCTRAVDGLMAAAGAAALFDDSPLQRAFRDLHAMSAHGALRFPAAAERVGQLELGLSPESPLPPI